MQTNQLSVDISLHGFGLYPQEYVVIRLIAVRCVAV